MSVERSGEPAAAPGGVTRALPTLAVLALAMCSLALSGCETTAEKSARLEKAAKRVAQAQQKGLSITRASRIIEVSQTAAVAGSEGSAAVVTLRNNSPAAQRAVPIAITLKNVRGTSVYTNDTPGLAPTLTSIALIPGHGVLEWVDDQITAKGESVQAKIGEGSSLDAPPPKLVVQGAHLADDPGGGTDAEGTVVNRSDIAQSELVIYAVARRGGRVVAAGRAVLESLAARASAPFQVFFVGDPKGASLELSVPATTPG